MRDSYLYSAAEGRDQKNVLKAFGNNKFRGKCIVPDVQRPCAVPLAHRTLESNKIVGTKSKYT